MARHGLLGVLLTSAILAGCLVPPPEEMETARSALLEQMDAQTISADAKPNDSWYVATFEASPEGGLGAFEWVVPAGARVPWGYNEAFDTDEQTVVLEVALVGAEEATAWGVLFFDDDGGKLRGTGGLARFPSTSVFYTADVEEETQDTDVGQTGFASLGWNVEEGERLRILGFVRGAAREVGIAFRVLDHDPHYPSSKEKPVESTEDFLLQRGATPPFALLARATGAGVEAQAYTDVLMSGLLPTDPGMGFEVVIGEPGYSWSAERRERAGMGTATFEGMVSGKLDKGFDAIDAAYVTVGGYESASYAAALTLHGGEAEASGSTGTLGGLPVFIPGMYSTSGVFASGAGDGEGESSALLNVERTRLGGLFSFLTLGSFEFGMSLDDLFGMSPEHELGASAEGDALPLVVFTPSGLVHHRADGSVMTWGMTLPPQAPIGVAFP